MIALRLKPLEAIASLLYPPACTICAAGVEAGEYLCADCNTKTTPIVPPFCEICSEPFAGAITSSFTCANCAHRKIYFNTAVAVYRSRGIVRRVIHDFKYGHQIHLRHLVAHWLIEALDDVRLRGRRFDVIIPVLLIDDVLTTGSTLSECARVLKDAGALSVYAATAARG